jgi:CRP/FNR family transcriptional regulator
MNDFTPFDLACYDKLNERFQYIFEAELINEICKYGRTKLYDADQIIIEIGDPIFQMPLVISGSIKIMTEDDEGDELLLYHLELGDTCAITLNCCTRKSKSTVKAVTETETELLFIPVEKMDDWMIKFKSWRAYVLESYNARLNEMLAAIDNIVFNSLEDRLTKYLRDKAWILKSEDIPISHQDIANDLHSSRVVITRLMKKLEKDGLIKQSRNKIKFLEFAKK